MFTLELDGDIIFQQVRLHPRSGSRTINGSGIKIGIIGDLQPGLNSNNFKVEISTGKLEAPLQSRSDSDTIFSCSGSFFWLASNFRIPDNRRGV